MSDREKAGLRGLVAVCETQAGSNILRERFHFDGRRSESSNAGTYRWTDRWLYHDDGRPQQEVFEGPSPFRRSFFYDDRGRRKHVRISDDSGERLEESYTYNEDGSVVFIAYPRLPAGCGIAIDSMLHMSSDAARIYTLQDSRGNALEKVLYNADDRQILRVLFVYDANGHLVEEGEALIGGGIRDDFRNCYDYDDAGRFTHIERHTPFGGISQTMRYNEVGDLIERHNLSLPSDIDMISQPPWTECFTYTYDERTNWTRRELIHRLDSGETPHREQQHRRLEYWSAN